MKESRTVQRRLVFTDEGQWAQLPSERRTKCRALLIRLLRQVAAEEVRAQRENHEREDPTDAS